MKVVIDAGYPKTADSETKMDPSSRFCMLDALDTSTNGSDHEIPTTAFLKDGLTDGTFKKVVRFHFRPFCPHDPNLCVEQIAPPSPISSETSVASIPKLVISPSAPAVITSSFLNTPSLHLERNNRLSGSGYKVSSQRFSS